MKNNVFENLDITQLNKDNILNIFKSKKNNKLCSLYLKWDYIKNNSNDLYNYLINYYNDINPITDTPTEILYRIVNNIKEKPKCPICGKQCTFNRYSRGYHMFCSTECK